MKNIFMICPISGSSESTQKKIAAYIKKKEKEGFSVYWSKRDRPKEEDLVGNIITKANLDAIRRSHEVHVWYDRNSFGSILELGAVFFMIENLHIRKKIVLVNKQAKDIKGPSYKKIIQYLENKTKHY